MLGATDESAAGPPPLLSSNPKLLLPPGALKVPLDVVATAVVGDPNIDGLIPVSVTATATALLVTLTTLSHGRFSDSVFLLASHKDRKLLFTPYGQPDPERLKSLLRLVHLAQYM